MTTLSIFGPKCFHNFFLRRIFFNELFEGSLIYIISSLCYQSSPLKQIYNNQSKYYNNLFLRGILRQTNKFMFSDSTQYAHYVFKAFDTNCNGAISFRVSTHDLFNLTRYLYTTTWGDLDDELLLCETNFTCVSKNRTLNFCSSNSIKFRENSKSADKFFIEFGRITLN